MRRRRNKTKALRATVDNARIDAIVIATSAVVAAEIVIAMSAVAVRIAIETAIATATNVNHARPPKKHVTPSRRPSRRRVATAPVAKAVAAKAKVRVRDVAAVGMSSVVVNRAVTTGASARLPRRLPRRLSLLLHRPHRRNRRQHRLQPSWAAQKESSR